MSRYATHLNNGKSGPEGLTRLLGKLLSGPGVLSSADLAVTAQGTPDMTVKVAVGDAAIYAGAIVYHGWSTANENVTIQSNVSGSSKTDAIVAYIDPALASTTENNPNAFVFVAVRGSSGAPTGTEINTAIGSKPSIVLATVTVGNGVTSINSGNIADQRTVVAIPRALAGDTLNQKMVIAQAGTGTINGVASGATADQLVTFAGLTTIQAVYAMPQRGSGGSGLERLTFSLVDQIPKSGNQVTFRVFNDGSAAAFISNTTYVAFGT